MLRPFVYQPRSSWGEDDPDRSGPWRFVIGVTALVILIGLTVTVLAADKPLPSGVTHRTRPIDPRCNTAARYDAMREAYERRLPDPCNSRARVWVE